MQRGRFLPLVVIATAAGIAGLAAVAPSIAAGALLHPYRSPLATPPPPGCVEKDFAAAGVSLRGWHCSVTQRAQGVVLFLHGVADNRGGAAGVVLRFLARGYDVVAYDNRAHGQSEGNVCTYGFHERADLSRVLDAVAAQRPVAVIGTSLGGAVALQTAAEDPRISVVVAAETFANLRDVARERAWFLPQRVLDRALEVAEQRGGFDVDAVAPAEAAKRITAPTLLIHGAADVDTAPAHSQRIYQNLRGRKRLLLVDAARHNQSLSGSAVWTEIERWVADSLPAERVERR